MSVGIRILYVDDDPAFAELVSTSLERDRETFDVVSESDPARALERIEAEPERFDCLVSDYEMKNMTGLELVSALRDRDIDLPMILFTGKGSEDIASEAISMGLTDYLQKSPGSDTYRVLANRIENAVSRRRSERARRQSEERYRRLVETSPTPIAISRPEDGIVYANPRLASFLGVDEPEQLHEQQFHKYSHESDGGLVTSTLEEVLETDEDASIERVRFRTATDEVKFATLAVAPVTYEDSPALQIVLNDVTEYERARRDLAETEVKYSTLVEQANDGVVILDDGRITFANQKAAEMLSMEQSTLTGTELSELVVADDVDLVTERFGEETEASRDEPVEFTATGADGTTVPIEVSASTIEFNGSQAHMTIWRDITERKKRKRELARYQTLVETAAEPMYLLDDDGTILMANDAMTELLGRDREEIVGNHATDFIDQSVYEAATEKLREALATDGPDYEKMEVEVTTAEGEQRVIETILTVLTEDGEHDRTIGVSRDMTERKRREQNLAEYETIIETVPVGLFALDSEGKITWANDEFYEIVGRSADQLIGMDFMSLVDDGHFESDIVDRYLKIVRQLLSSDTESDRETYMVSASSPDGDSMVLETHTALLPLDEGEFTGTVTAVRDITKQKEYERELERQNERLERFADLISHDLRNPLNVARGYVEIARNEHSDFAFEKIDSSMERMEQLVDELLTLAKQGEGIGELETVELASMATEAWENVSTGDATLETTGSMRVLADRLRLQQLFENLMRNSIEHGTETSGPEPGSSAADRPDVLGGDRQQSRGGAQSIAPTGSGLTVSVGPLENGFYIADDGVGIPADDRDDIFELGYTTADGGTGFGLGIVTEVVDAHDWTIDITESESGGARFEVTGVDRP
jgi:PAS domain S-box-containing protein